MTSAAAPRSERPPQPVRRAEGPSPQVRPATRRTSCPSCGCCKTRRRGRRCQEQSSLRGTPGRGDRWWWPVRRSTRSARQTGRRAALGQLGGRRLLHDVAVRPDRVVDAETLRRARSGDGMQRSGMARTGHRELSSTGSMLRTLSTTLGRELVHRLAHADLAPGDPPPPAQRDTSRQGHQSETHRGQMPRGDASRGMRGTTSRPAGFALRRPPATSPTVSLPPSARRVKNHPRGTA